MIIQNGVGITTLLNGETVKTALNAANEIVNRGIYNATTLSAVDADLQAANIKLAETIFGFLGTVAPGALAEDTSGDAKTGVVGDTVGGYYKNQVFGNTGEEYDFATVTPTFDASSLAFGVAFAAVDSVDQAKIRLYMGGVEVAESGPCGAYDVYRVTGFRALSGAQIVKGSFHCYGDGISGTSWTKGYTSLPWGVAAGSVKLV